MRTTWTFIAVAALAALAAVQAGSVAAQTYPSRPIRVIVPYPPGGSTDPTARLIGAWIAEKLGQQVVIDNRPGAGSTIGHGLGAKATPDGYTLLLGTSGGLVVSPAFGTRVPYDPVKDFAPVGLVVYAPFMLTIHPSLPATNLKEFIAHARAQPGKVSFASPGVGTPNHLGMELLTAMTGAKFLHVPYKGGGPAMIDMVAGRAQAIFAGVPQALPPVQAGRLKVIATGHPTRVFSMPHAAPIAEALPGFNNTTWYGLLAPAGTPRAIIDKLNAEIGRAVANADFQKRLAEIGLEPASGTPVEFQALIRTELTRWTKVIKDAGIAPAD